MPLALSKRLSQGVFKSIRPLWRPLATFALGILALTAYGPVAAAPTDGQQFKDWTIRCAKPSEEATEELCGMVQIVTDESGENPVLMAEIGYVPGEDRPIGRFTVPLGVLLPAGMEVQVDDAEEVGRAPFTVCHPIGCIAIIRLDDKVVGMFKKGVTLKITLHSPQGQSKTVPLSLSGFTAAFNSLQ
jgi:invasion protein IalB